MSNKKLPALRSKSRVVLDLERHVPYFFTYISTRLSRGASDSYRQYFGLGITEWRVMGVIAGAPGISANQITNSIGLDKGAVSRALAALEKSSFVVLTADPDDNRSRFARLTRSGEKVHDRIIIAALERERRLLRGLSKEETEIFIACLRKLRGNVSYVNSYDPGEDPAVWK